MESGFDFCLLIASWPKYQLYDNPFIFGNMFVKLVLGPRCYKKAKVKPRLHPQTVNMQHSSAEINKIAQDAADWLLSQKSREKQVKPAIAKQVKPAIAKQVKHKHITHASPKIAQSEQTAREKRNKRQALLHRRVDCGLREVDKKLLDYAPLVVCAVGDYLDSKEPKAAASVIQITSRFVNSPSNKSTLRSKLEQLIQNPSATLASFMRETNNRPNKSKVNNGSIGQIVHENAQRAVNGNGKGSFYVS